jgi:hypothetical protein
MQNKTWKRIESNPNLVAFCNRILNYNSILEHEMTRSMFFVSLISADSLIDIHSCDETIEISNFILNHLDLLILEENIKNDVIKYLNNAIKIAERDKKNFEYELLKDYR